MPEIERCGDINPASLCVGESLMFCHRYKGHDIPHCNFGEIIEMWSPVPISKRTIVPWNEMPKKHNTEDQLKGQGK